MTDFMTPKQRSKCMSRVRGKNTKPELTLRKRLWAQGFRYRLQSNLPGKPDIVLPKYKTVLFVHGCFWHHHEGCPKSKLPDTRTEFWTDKIAANVDRDRRNIAELKHEGWRIAIVWECSLKKRIAAEDTIEKLLNWIRSDEMFFESVHQEGQ